MTKQAIPDLATGLFLWQLPGGLRTVRHWGDALLPMTILRGLTSTKKDRIPAFIEALRRSGTRQIALFPTCLNPEERRALYAALSGIAGLAIPHVHLRSDSFPGELDYLVARFGTEAFNIHPRGSSHPFGSLPPAHAHRIFIENVEFPPEAGEFDSGEGPAPGGLCPDFSHLENARLHARSDYIATMEAHFDRLHVGCCHLSAVRIGVPNEWNGEWDHHSFVALSDFDYLARYSSRMPSSWASLELENSFEEQGEAIAYLSGLLVRY